MAPSRRHSILVLDECFDGKLRHLREQVRGRSVEATKADALHGLAQSSSSSFRRSFVHRRTMLEDLESHLEREPVSVVLVVPNWRRWAARPHKLSCLIANASSRPGRPALVLVDTVDQTSSPFLACLPHVERILKSQVLRDRGHYLHDTATPGNPFAEWCRDSLGFDLGDWRFGSTTTTEHVDRILPGWNMGVSRFYRGCRRLTQWCALPWRDRRYDLSRRFLVPDPTTSARWDYYRAYRRFCGLSVGELARSVTMTETSPVGRAAFLRELSQSRITFSPFGWGEVCFRDFEAVACGSVLLKPDMSHLETWPNIYEAGVTYVPVRWDLTDLSAQVAWILDNPARAEEIAREAAERLERAALIAGFSDLMYGLTPATGQPDGDCGAPPGT